MSAFETQAHIHNATLYHRTPHHAYTRQAWRSREGSFNRCIEACRDGHGFAAHTHRAEMAAWTGHGARVVRARPGVAVRAVTATAARPDTNTTKTQHSVITHACIKHSHCVQHTDTTADQPGCARATISRERAV